MSLRKSFYCRQRINEKDLLWSLLPIYLFEEFNLGKREVSSDGAVHLSQNRINCPVQTLFSPLHLTVFILREQVQNNKHHPGISGFLPQISPSA